MNARQAYWHGIREIERIVRMHRLKRFLENAALIFLCLFTASSGMQWLGWKTAAVAAVFYPAAGISLLCAALWVWAGEKPLQHRLIEIDAGFHLQDRLSTAYEYLQQRRQSEFLDPLIRDAAQILFRMDKNKIFPKRISWIHLLLSVLIVINVLMAAVKYPFAVNEPDAVDPETLEKIQQLIVEPYSTGAAKNGSRGAKNVSDRIRDRISDRMRGLSDMLDHPPVSRSRLAAAVQNSLQEIRQEKSARADDLVQELGLSGTDEVSVRQIRRSDYLSHFQLKKLREITAGIFDGRIPEAVSDDLAVLEEYRRLEAYLEQILDNLEKETLRQAAPQKTAPEDSHAETAFKDPEETQNQAQSAQHADGDRNVPSIDAAQEAGGKEGPYGQTAEDEPGNGSSSAGRGKSEPSSAPADAPDPLKGAAMQENTASSPGAEVSVLIRSLTAIGTAGVNTEQVAGDYQRALEGVLEKEEIPWNRKSAVRNYFLSIGLGKE